MKKWFPQKDSLDSTAALMKTIVCHLRIPVSIASIERIVSDHLEYPSHSLRSLQQILSLWGIRTLETRIRLADIPPFSILVLNDLNPQNACVPYELFYKIDGDVVKYRLQGHGWVEEELESFEQKWSKTALAITAINLQLSS